MITLQYIRPYNKWIRLIMYKNIIETFTMYFDKTVEKHFNTV